MKHQVSLGLMAVLLALALLAPAAADALTVTVRIEGKYPSGPDRFLQVQRWEGGEWLTFPYPAKTDKSGRFTAFVEPGPPGRYRLRLRDPESGVTSETFVLVIKG